MRLHNYLKNNGNLTKSELTQLNNKDLILVNGKKVSLLYEVKESDIVTMDGKVISPKEYRYFIYHKPKGVICTNNKSIKGNIQEALELDFKVSSVGRLDKDSRGLLILTNDGKLADYILNPVTHLEKEYIVKVEKKIDDTFKATFGRPIEIKGKMTKEAEVSYIDEYTFSIVLKEGKYRQIRKMVIDSNNKVIDLFRIRIGNIKIDDLEEGKIQEIKNLKEVL